MTESTMAYKFESGKKHKFSCEAHAVPMNNLEYSEENNQEPLPKGQKIDGYKLTHNKDQETEWVSWMRKDYFEKHAEEL